MVDDKWSAFKDLDFGTPSATTAVPGQSGGVAWGSDWGASTTATATAAAPVKQDDFWGSSASNEQTSSNLWGDTGQSNTTDLFADAKSTSSPAASDLWGSSDAWGSTPSSTATSTTATSQSSNLFGDSNAFSAKPTVQPLNTTAASASAPFKLPPPQKTPKKETTFGFPEQKAPVSAEVQRSAAVAAPAVEVSAVSQNRKVEIYEAQYDFAARNTDELDLVAEEKIKVCLYYEGLITSLDC